MFKVQICIVLAGLLSVNIAAAKRPNLIFLMADDQSFYTMGCYGNPDVKTPNFDQLAKDGMAFDRHYDTTAICMASRATVMTGMYEYKTGCNFSHGDMMNDTWKKSYPVLLRKAGYRTAFAGKFGFDLKADPAGKRIGIPAADFDAWAGGGGQTSYNTSANKGLRDYVKEFPHSTLAYGAFGSDFIEESAAGEQPFCLSISFKAPHRPTLPDPRFDEVYEGVKFTKPENFGREHGAHFSKQSQQGRQYERFKSWKYDDKYDEVMAVYHQQIYAIDQAVGMIRKALKESGADQNTVIIYTSDNGFFCGSHGYGSKVLPYEEGSRVPLIIYDPRHENSGKALRSGALSGNVDFAPTLLSLAGVPVPKNMDGRNLMELYENPTAEIHESLPLINVWGPIETHVLGVVTRDTKYMLWSYAGKGYEPTEELYRLDKDSLELKNLASNPEEKERLEQMQKRYDGHLDQWKAEVVDYNGYEEFGIIFDRTIPWDEKAELVESMHGKMGE